VRIYPLGESSFDVFFTAGWQRDFKINRPAFRLAQEQAFAERITFVVCSIFIKSIGEGGAAPGPSEA
jgi:hypothetical protein